MNQKKIERIKKIDLLFIVLICTTFLFLGKRVDRTNWNQFEALTYLPKYDKVMDQVTFEPHWNLEMLELAGEKVQLTGYFEQIDGRLCFTREKTFPTNSQELGRQVLQIDQKELNFKVHFDKKCMIEGYLELNQSDVNQLPFRITNAHCLRCVSS